MSKQLSPEEQREIRARYGSDVQTQFDAPFAIGEPFPVSALKSPEYVKAMKQTMAFISERLGVPIEVQPEDRLRAHIIEACEWLRCGAPSRALETLENALKL